MAAGHQHDGERRAGPAPSAAPTTTDHRRRRGSRPDDRAAGHVHHPRARHLRRGPRRRHPDGRHQLELVNLDTSDGPDLRVWLSDQPVKAGTAGWRVFDDGRWVELGELKGNKGNQVYDIPADADLDDPAQRLDLVQALLGLVRRRRALS